MELHARFIYIGQHIREGVYGANGRGRVEKEREEEELYRCFKNLY